MDKAPSGLMQQGKPQPVKLEVLDELYELTNQLSDILEEETALLDALDLPAAAGLLPRKRDAVAALQNIVASGRLLADTVSSAGSDLDVLRGCIERMSVVGDANRIAIERGVALQMRVIQAIASAVPRARAVEAPTYQPNGSKVAARPPEAFAFLSRM